MNFPMFSPSQFKENGQILGQFLGKIHNQEKVSIEVSNIHGKCLYLLADYVDMTPLLESTKEQT